MDDLISRQAAIDEIDEWIKAFRENGHKESAADACLIQDGIIQLPSVDAAQVRHGHWEECEVLDENCVEVCQSARCSICGRYHTTPYMYYFDQYKYCPTCGATMDGEQND